MLKKVIYYYLFSVVTSISVLTQDDPESMREQHERDYKKYAVESMQATVTQPKFKFYLYNENGDLVQEELSIHDIQHFLLHTASYNANTQNYEHYANTQNNSQNDLNGDSENASLNEDEREDSYSKGKPKYIYTNHYFVSHFNVDHPHTFVVISCIYIYRHK